MEGRSERVRPRSEPQHRVTRVVGIAVQDSGPGLDSKSVDWLFDAFYMTKRDGLGMELAISRSIVESHDRRLWATSNDDHGATCQFTLPTESESVS